MNTNPTSTVDLDWFSDYVASFYDIDRADALYPFATSDELARAIAQHVANPSPLFPFDGDTMDREVVRDIVHANRRAVRTV
jgi:hypothetical protein